MNLAPVFGAQLPSLFRGVVVADSPAGVRVVSVEDASQAFLADLRPEDVILQINGASIRTIDEFAAASSALKGRTVQAEVIVLRRGDPKALTVHLYSYPVLRQWDVAFVPDYELRFVDAKAGWAYWIRMSRGHATAGDWEAALDAALNGLHHDPTNLDAALRASELLGQVATQRLARQQLAGALQALEQATRLLARAFEQLLTEEQLRHIKRQLEDARRLLRDARPRA